MSLLYISQGDVGSTSKFRLEIIKSFYKEDVDEISYFDFFAGANYINKRLAWRVYWGPVIWRINKEVKNRLVLQNKFYHIIWIDKGVFLSLSTMEMLRKCCKYLIHYTPDTAFLGNNSRHFRNSINFFDFVITTKTFEIPKYSEYYSNDKLIYLSQGYNKSVHFARCHFNLKRFAISFIGLYEDYRANIILTLLQNGYTIHLGGIGWESFYSRYSSFSLIYLGSEVKGSEYALAISNNHFALGLLSKKFPELHTTRTFEIPACGTCLITERNFEIDSFFLDSECIKFNTVHDILKSLLYFRANMDALKRVTEAGSKRVIVDKRDYHSQMDFLINQLDKI